MITIRKQKGLQTFILYVIGFILIWEWLRPLQQITEIKNLPVFLGFLVIGFVLSFLGVHWILRIIINGCYMILVINHLYYQEPLITLLKLDTIIKDFALNIGHVFRMDWLGLTNSFRTFLLFVTLDCIVFLYTFWVKKRKGIFFFVLITIIYLAILDTFFPFQADYAVIRTFIIGLAATGLAHFSKLVEQERLTVSFALIKRWPIPLVVIILVCAGVGIVIPKPGPIWPDPMPYVVTFANQEDGNMLNAKGKLHKIGYDEDDTQLGGGFIKDDTPVFTVKSPEKQYWRVETKDFYSGKGWVVSEKDNFQQIKDSEELPIYSVEPEYLGETSELEVVFMERRDHVIYPQGVNRLKFHKQNFYHYNEANEKIQIPPDNQLSSYTVQYQRPAFIIEDLKNVTASENLRKDMPDFYTRYTQLPENLPARVKELAIRLTENENNQYDKVKAIEEYLQSSRFTYKTENIPIPGKEEDYVDQFLFETMIGYCDNFSTSMAVLLRSVGIPSRWVKGYTGGTVIGSEGELTTYKITNNNAHSWVEVYFSGIGWVPFEPTNGFTNAVDFIEETETVSTENALQQERESESNVQPEEPNQQRKQQTEQQIEEQSEPNSDKETKPFTINNDWKNVKIWWVIGGMLAGIFVLLSYILRRRWLPYWVIFQYRNKNDAKSFMPAYLALLKRLEKSGVIKEEDETLNQFAKRVDEFFNNDFMSRLTEQYERYLYRNEQVDTGWGSCKPIWEELMKLAAEKKLT
ncbi:transglutaminaseTgpA domain-containing protein [Caldifermentibacillus hisashii]|uniref:transglutaminaseTgpA domain-containing protein n=1 Tax=Caldifermentibacillus hisashii TaxID=996558 RepID=UPI0033672AE4